MYVIVIRSYLVTRREGLERESGKLEPGETPLQAAKRELEEEACIQAPLEHAGELLFVIEGDQTAFHIDIFRADEYAGIVTETDEMRPQWFRTDDTTPHKAGSSEDKNTYLPIPFDQMWDDDVHWFPLLLKKQFFVGRSDFLRDGDNFVPCRWWFGTDC
ncbi:hypothetical protein AMATHDRAFT_77064 [Amanita thiersii Skay4041]|uniref:Nudix hydrolase domain-containing protein n=1 Tax=Amanita thiersii Skay4041 TaxID=703135 RepID=A0A2A9NAQ4_9AGAR|nr:hypothetical protein AMATHDRAFT_77064 [Amanita thiersii Skay4041]